MRFSCVDLSVHCQWQVNITVKQRFCLPTSFDSTVCIKIYFGEHGAQPAFCRKETFSISVNVSAKWQAIVGWVCCLIFNLYALTMTLKLWWLTVQCCPTNLHWKKNFQVGLVWRAWACDSGLKLLAFTRFAKMAITVLNKILSSAFTLHTRSNCLYQWVNNCKERSQQNHCTRETEDSHYFCLSCEN